MKLHMNVRKTTEFQEGEEKQEFFSSPPQELIDLLTGLDMKDLEFSEEWSGEMDEWVYAFNDGPADPYSGSPHLLVKPLPHFIVFSFVPEFNEAVLGTSDEILLITYEVDLLLLYI